MLGDAVNYSIGYFVGPRVFSRENSWLLNKKHLMRAQKFYEDYGGITIILARFIPIVRTFAPFVAGIGKMSYRRFAVYNVAGGTAWILLFPAGRLVVRRPEVRSEELQAGDRRHHRDLGAAGRVRVSCGREAIAESRRRWSLAMQAGRTG